MDYVRWRTAITKVEPSKILLRGYRIEELMRRVSFAGAVYLALRGELPSEAEVRMIDAILVSCIDHGTTPQSTIAAMTAASAGSPLNAAVAAGVLAISRHHGGAIEEAMLFLRKAVEMSEGLRRNEAEAASEIVKEYRSAGKRIPGYGHLIHTKDPRTVRLLGLAKELGFFGKHIALAKQVEAALQKESGKKLPLNADGAIAVVLLEMGFEPELGNAFFIISRLPGLVAHIQEELARYKPLRRIDPHSAEYDGPPERRYPG